MSILCSMVGASFNVAAVVTILRAKKGIIAYGNAQVSTAQSKFGGSSAFFDGTGDALTINHEGSMRFGTGDFAIEFWYRPVSRAKAYPIVFSNKSGFDAGNIVFHDRHSANTTKLTVWIYNLSSSAPIFTTTTTTVDGTWYHIALTRSGTSLKLFVNGTQEGSTYTTSADIDTGAGTVPYQISATGADSEYNGYLDEVRVSNTARYTANFTPSTTAFVNDANTLLLMHCNGTNATTFFDDDNGTVRAQAGIYRVNGPVISTAQSKFGGSSLYFDETSGQEVNVAYNTVAQGLTNNGDFTVELWAYFTKLPSSGDTGYMMFYSHGPEPYILMQNGGVYLGAGGYPSFASTFTTNTWYHIAVSRSSGNLRCFVNGTQAGSTVTGSTYNYIPYTDNLTTRFGKFGDDRGRWQGYMDEIRFSKTARYTANFSVATTPFVNDADTLFLIHGDGTNGSTVFRDDNGQGRSAVGIAGNGNAQIDTAQSKFGGSSLLLDGTGDWLETTGVNISRSDNFTCEAWIRLAALPGTNSFSMLLSGVGGGEQYMSIKNISGTYVSDIVVNNGSTIREEDYTISSISTNTWYHWAIVKNGSTLTHYFNGTALTTLYASSGTMSSGHGFNAINKIGVYSNNSLGWNGHLDEVRVSNTARYTANFTPSTTPFQNDANTVLLLHMDGTDASTVFTDDNGIAPYTI